MSDSVAKPENLDELHEVLRSEELVLPVGNQTKKPLAIHDRATRVSLQNLNGILEYEPSEFTFTAFAGTLITEVMETLLQRNQYLPFDPMLVRDGATLGGMVGAGLSGPGRFRYGGLRDFLLGVKFCSGDGEVINAGGKVVKNAAGFDIPKLLVGSIGRLGAMVELTFKVFPHPGRQHTLAVACASPQQALERMATAASSQWELDAIDYRPERDGETVFLRLAGPDEVNQSMVGRIVELWGADVSEKSQSDGFWESVNELDWSGQARAFAVKIPTHRQTLEALSAWSSNHTGVDLHVSAAGAVSWVLCDSQQELDALNDFLTQQKAAGLLVRGETDRIGIGCWPRTDVSTAVKQAMDPASKFPPLFHA